MALFAWLFVLCLYLQRLQPFQAHSRCFKYVSEYKQQVDSQRPVLCIEDKLFPTVGFGAFEYQVFLETVKYLLSTIILDICSYLITFLGSLPNSVIY